MINYTHKPCCPDGKNAIKVAERLKRKAATMQENQLEFLLAKRFETSQIIPINLNELNDFPMLKKHKLARKILFGTYQLRQSKSYLTEIIKTQRGYVLAEKFIESINNEKIKESLNDGTTKIIGVNIVSRHSRSLVKRKISNNVMIKRRNIIRKYQKTSKYMSIKSKLKNDKIVEKYKMIYKVFIEYKPNTNKTSAIKRYVCNCKTGKRIIGCCVHVATLLYYLSNARFKPINIPAEHLNSIFVDLSKKEPANEPKYVRRRRNLKQNASSSSDSSSTEDDSDSVKEKERNQDEFVIDNNTSQELHYENYSIELLKTRIPKWGADIIYNNKKYYLSNTCTIDYFLLALWFIHKIDNNFIQNIPILEFTQTLKEIIMSIEQLDWNKAKQLWVLNIMDLEPLNQNEFSVFGSVTGRFSDYLLNYQLHQLRQLCDTNCVLNKTRILSEDSARILFIKQRNRVKVDSLFSGRCINCNTMISTEIIFKHNPNFLFIEPAGNNIFVHEIPKQIIFSTKTYILMCVTAYKPGHMVGIFNIYNDLYLIDDLSTSAKLLSRANENILRREYFQYTEEYYYNKKGDITAALYFSN